MPKPPLEGEVLGPGDQHAYDDDNLDPKEFLTAIYKDKKLPISVRMEAATKVAVYMHPRLQQVNQNVEGGLTIRIEGGLPDLPGTNIIMPEHEKVAKKTNGSGQ